MSPTPAQFLLLLAGYFALHVLVRILLSRGVELDESEQVLLAQRWSWGYGVQPPLYTWIQSAAFALFGLSTFALSLVKNALLLGTFIFTCLGARMMLRHRLAAATAAAGLLLFPQIAWEAQRDLTHSVLAMFMAAVTLFILLRLRERGGFIGYIALGAAMGLGLLSKYNYAAFVGALLAAGLTLPSWRRVILNRGVWLTAVTFVLVMLPHALWLWSNRTAVLAGADLEIEPRQAWLTSAAEGMAELGEALLGLLALVSAVFALACWKPPAERALDPDADPDHLRLIVRKSIIVLVAVLVAVPAFGMTEFKERWLMPMVVALPAGAILLCRRRLDESRLGRVLTICIVIGIGVLIALGSSRIIGGWIDYPTRLGAPFPELAEALEAEIHDVDLIIADGRWIGGNLRMFHPDRPVVVPELWRVPVTGGGRCLIVWDLRRHSVPPPRLVRFARAYADIPDEPIFQQITVPYRFYENRTLQLGYFHAELNPSTMQGASSAGRPRSRGGENQ